MDSSTPLILYMLPKPSNQIPHHNNHSVTEPEINVGLCDQMDMGRWTQQVSCVYSVAIMPSILYHFDILINSKLLSTWLLIRREIADALDTEQWHVAFAKCVQCISYLSDDKSSIRMKHKASVLLDVSEVTAPQFTWRTAWMMVSHLPPPKREPMP